MARLFRVLPLVIALPLVAAGQGFPPDAAVKRMTLPDGFTVTPVASEPTVRQPVALQFDARGRLWVLQYLQYPTPAGLRAVSQDQYLRTVWDKVPEPPPAGPKGADRLTILSDPDDRGVYRKSRDFLTGMNMATGFCPGRGGVFVAQPPYLLFYPDRDEDDVADGDPEVLLSGFGMEDPHAYANSLQWGPDGWLYGAQGSTVTARIKNPAKPEAPPVEFQQGVWRYHPKTPAFELFSEGGGNTWGLDFDKHGQVIAGTNWGGFAMLHQVQGAYYLKGFSKHGPLHNPHAYGHFDHVPYKDFKGGHVTCGGIVYQAEAFPPEYRDQYIGANLLSNAVYRHDLTPNGSTFKAKHGADLIAANDTWFRPVDMLLGPDGAVYVADWYDRRANHVDPVDNWDRTNGRVYRIDYRGTPKPAPFDLRQKSSAELVELLKHSNKWWRNEARRLLADRADAAVILRLREQVKADAGLLALESLWALYTVGGFDEAFARDVVLKHPFEHVRSWGVRLLGDVEGKPVEPPTRAALIELAGNDPSPTVRCQLACTAKRLPADQGLPVAAALVARNADGDDPFIPLLVWWAFESKVDSDPDAVRSWILTAQPQWNTKLGRVVLERLARRYVAADPPRWADVMAMLDKAGTESTAILAGVEAALQGKSPGAVPENFVRFLRWRAASPSPDPQYGRLLVRVGDAGARAAFLKAVADPSKPDAVRARALELLTQVKAPGLADVLPKVIADAKTDAVRFAALAALESIDDLKTADLILAGYPGWSAPVRQRAVGLLTSRPAWALALLKAVDAGTFPKAALTVDAVRPVVAFKDQSITALAEKHWGKIGPATAGEKQARIRSLAGILAKAGPGDAVRGKATFAKSCAACHQLFGEGGKVGPDLTAADRKNRGYMLAQVIDPSGYIRPEFVSYTVNTADGRALTGLVSEAGEEVAVTAVVGDKPQRTVVPKKDVESIAPSSLSLMPEKLLDALSDDDIRDLFAYLSSDPPATPPR